MLTARRLVAIAAMLAIVHPAALVAQIPLDQVTVHSSPAEVLTWPITSEITAFSLAGGKMRIDHTRRGFWPPVVISDDGTTQEATVWVFFNINGRWHAAGGERLRPGQNEKELGHPSDIGTGWFYNAAIHGELTGYMPQPGELVGFMVAAGSTRVDNKAPVHERTRIVEVPFPSDTTGGVWPPFAWVEGSTIGTPITPPPPSGGGPPAPPPIVLPAIDLSPVLARLGNLELQLAALTAAQLEESRQRAIETEAIRGDVKSFRDAVGGEWKKLLAYAAPLVGMLFAGRATK